ncbi:hypothetical protein QBD01_001083 [Ochrobactrum sp. 19YEA23]|uniref:hypothetical protein n=1 Tax=Ochrobactrum sp. 19YEA23 TaxID=3039854 RepID=UPI00247A82C1|nr:hypothetical protein [Ochrobactrum sp. 19YEA23]
MMGFRATPSFNTLSPGQMVQDAYAQPMGIGSTFLDQLGGGALESYGLGTFLRGSSLPMTAPLEKQSVYTGRTIGGLQEQRFETDEEFSARRKAAGAMTQDEYIASPYYRNNIPYDAGMTRDRAATLAAWDDAKKVRQFYAEKRPVTSFFGNLAGQALDPINYIPVAGPLVKGAAAAKFGRVGGAALAGSLDAATNTAVFGLATADARADLGDDVSWQAMTTDIAMAALIGGAFGAVGGVLGRRADARLEAATKEQLSTLRNVQEARIALNEAIDGLLTEGEVKLSPNAIEPLARVTDEVAPRVAIDSIARNLEPATFERLDALDRTFEINSAEIARLTSLSIDNERFGPTRAAMIEAERLAERLEKAEANVAKAGSDKERAAAVQRRDAIRTDLRERLSLIDDNVVREIETIDESLRARRSANEPVSRERMELQQRVEQLQADARKAYWADATENFNRISSPVDDVDPAVNQSATPVTELAAPGTRITRPAVSAIDVSRPRPEPIPDGRSQAENSVGRPDDYRALAEQYRVDPANGSFVEEADIAQLEFEGRLTEADKAAIAAAQSTFDDGAAYGEALKAAVACLI